MQYKSQNVPRVNGRPVRQAERTLGLQPIVLGLHLAPSRDGSGQQLSDYASVSSTIK